VAYLSDDETVLVAAPAKEGYCMKRAKQKSERECSGLHCVHGIWRGLRGGG
jgi:hypothetical protein